MHDTHDVRKSKELHDKELIAVLTRIAKSLEYIEGGLIQVLGRSIE